MGGSLNKSLKPEELVVFKKLPTDRLLTNIDIPERAENRKPTDTRFLIAFFVVAVLLIPFLIYSLIYSDIGRITNGYDPCGNVCGQENDKYDQWSCTGQDFTDKEYLQYDDDVKDLGEHTKLLVPRKCVSECVYGPNILGECMSSTENKYEEKLTAEEELELESVGAYLRSVAWRITLACFLSLGFTIAMLVLFRTATAAMVWSILAGVFVFGSFIVGACWYSYFQAEESIQNNKQGLLFLSIFLTVALLILFCVMVFMYKKIALVILLLKEAMKAAFAMPQLIFIPVLTFIVQVTIVFLLVITSVTLYSSGTLTEIVDGYLVYQQNFVMVFTIIFNVLMAFWALQFILGIQYMVIGGAVTKWYFATNKDYLGSPIKTSASIAFKYHLGSIAFGSLVITLMAIVRALVTSITKNNYLRACVDFFLKNIEDFLKFLSKNSYILTAMHGKPFFKSGKRAAKIILENAVNIVALNYIGDFVLGMAQLIIVMISMLMTWGIMAGTHPATELSSAAAYIIVFLVSIVIACTFFSIFETVIDTIFLCFCEDSLLNDGMARPYAMSRELMEFVEGAKKVFGDKKKE